MLFGLFIKSSISYYNKVKTYRGYRTFVPKVTTFFSGIFVASTTTFDVTITVTVEITVTAKNVTSTHPYMRCAATTLGMAKKKSEREQ